MIKKRRKLGITWRYYGSAVSFMIAGQIAMFVEFLFKTGFLLFYLSFLAIVFMGLYDVMRYLNCGDHNKEF